MVFKIMNAVLVVGSGVLVGFGLVEHAQYAVLLLIAYNSFSLGRIVYY